MKPLLKLQYISILWEDQNPEQEIRCFQDLLRKMKRRKKRKMNEELEKLAEEAEFDNNGEIHLWLADLKKAMDFENRDEAEGARKLVEKASWLFGTHGYQLIQEMENDE